MRTSKIFLALSVIGSSSYYVYSRRNLQAEQNEKLSVGIIGAGIGGTSCAHFLRKDLRKKKDVSVDITIFEREDRVGGRNFSDRNLEDGKGFSSIEWGGSHIIEENKYAMGLIEEFSLHLRPKIKKSWFEWLEDIYTFLFPFAKKKTDDLLVIWDSDQEKPLYQDTPSQLWNMITILTNSQFGYGFFPLRRTKKEIDQQLRKFGKVYDMQENGFTYDSPHQLLEALDMKSLIEKDFWSHITVDKKVHENFARVFIEPILRVNYMQNAKQLSAFAGVIGAAGLVSKFHAVEEGTQSFAENITKKTDVNLFLNTQVTTIQRENGKYRVTYVNTMPQGKAITQSEVFDYIIVATPMEAGSLKFKNVKWSDMAKNIDVSRPYVKGHTTILASNDMKVERMGLKRYPVIKGTNLPKFVYSILTTEQVGIVAKNSLPFNILGYNGVTKKFNQNGHLVFKLFSHEYLADELLKEYFSEPVYISRMYWHKPGNYPYLSPNPLPVPTKLDRDGRLYYVNAMESIISTIETTLIQSRNVSLLISSEINKKNKD